MLQVPGGSDAQQVMLQVRIAEVNRRALMEFGTSFFTGATGAGDWIGRGTTRQFPSVEFSELSAVRDHRPRRARATSSSTDKMEFSDFLNIFLFNTSWNAGTLIRALKQTGLLPEPRRAESHRLQQQGGELPRRRRVSDSDRELASGQVSIEFKEFGVRLNFTPTIAGDLIRLKVRPEVSELDFNNGITLEGFRIPALQTRRAETEVELRDGQSFAVAGLIDNTAQTDQRRDSVAQPGPDHRSISSASKAERQERTELLVLITPRLVRPLNPDEVPALPTLPGRFLPPGDDLGEPARRRRRNG